VPAAVQNAIRSHVEPRLAYVPMTAPPGYRYASWIRARSRPHGLTIWFRWRRARYPGLGFNVGDGCGEFGATMKLFRFGGVRVRWSTTYSDAQAWRCAKRQGRWIHFYASAPGYGSASGPSPRSLALMIASARRAG
jgi:hypothetical protein